MRRLNGQRSRGSRNFSKVVREREARLPRPPAEVPQETPVALPQDVEVLLHYQDLYNLAPVPFYTLDRRGRIVEVNEKGARLLGFAPEWLYGKSFVVWVARQDVPRFLNFLMVSREGEQALSIDVDLFVGSYT